VVMDERCSDRHGFLSIPRHSLVEMRARILVGRDDGQATALMRSHSLSSPVAMQIIPTWNHSDQEILERLRLHP
jgi:hypothetical protein